MFSSHGQPQCCEFSASASSSVEKEKEKEKEKANISESVSLSHKAVLWRKRRQSVSHNIRGG
jgi:hypothetical protein